MKPKSRSLPARIRLILAAAALVFFVYAYLSPDLASNLFLAPLMKTQFSPALYGAGIAVPAVLLCLVLALIFGRAFCSVLCPLGTLQELVWRAGNVLRGVIRRGESPPPGTLRAAKGCAPGTVGSAPVPRPGFRRIRCLLPLLAGLALIFAVSPLMAVFDPISNFGRAMVFFRGIFGGSPRFSAVFIALPALGILAAAFLRGRVFCGWCPVGQTLGFLAGAAPLGMRLDSRCSSCGICEKKCPSRCLYPAEKRIDADLCVLCFSCAAACPRGSAGYGLRRKRIPPEDARQNARRNFLKGTLPFLGGAVYLFGVNVRTLARLAAPGGGQPGGPPAILPPGAKNAAYYRSRCVGCQACAAACPVGIIRGRRPAAPVLDYAEAPCQYNCVECGRVCPTGAIRSLTLEEKRRTRIALSALIFERCVVKTKGQSCGACAEVCPTRAVRMVSYGESGIPGLTRPVFDGPYCIGCGACLVACPAEPRAFVITSVADQTLTPGLREEDDGDGEAGEIYQMTGDFPF